MTWKLVKNILKDDNFGMFLLFIIAVFPIGGLIGYIFIREIEIIYCCMVPFGVVSSIIGFVLFLALIDKRDR